LLGKSTINEGYIGFIQLFSWVFLWGIILWIYDRIIMGIIMYPIPCSYSTPPESCVITSTMVKNWRVFFI
jgi:hypothetical protein